MQNRQIWAKSRVHHLLRKWGFLHKLTLLYNPSVFIVEMVQIAIVLLLNPKHAG